MVFEVSTQNMSRIILGTGCIGSGLVTLNKQMALSLFVDTVFSLSLSLSSPQEVREQTEIPVYFPADRRDPC